MSLLVVEGLSKAFRHGFFGRQRHVAVDDVGFELERGRTLSLVGESGAGKSTTGRLILRLIEPDAGQVTLDGIDVGALDRRSLRELRRRMQMVFQDPYSSFDPRVDIIESVAEPLKIHEDLSSTERLDRAGDAMSRCRLAGSLFHRFPGEMSGGQLQRAAIARALTLEPELLVLDEPVAALDVSVQAQIVNLLVQLQEDLGLSYLFISHDLALVRAITDEVAIMLDGRIVETGPAEAVYGDPRQAYTRDLLSAVPRLELRSS